MATKQRFWETTVTIKVLSDGINPPEYPSIRSIEESITLGYASGHWNSIHKEINREELIAKCKDHGTDPNFFVAEEIGEDEFLEVIKEPVTQKETQYLYETFQECKVAGLHLRKTDESGYCNACGWNDQ